MAHWNSWFPYQQFVDVPQQTVNVYQAGCCKKNLFFCTSSGPLPRPSGPSGPGKTVEIPKLGFGDPTSVKLIGDVPWLGIRWIDRICEVSPALGNWSTGYWGYGDTMSIEWFHRILMEIQWWFNGDLMVINPVVILYEWLIGGFTHVLVSIIYGMSSFPLTFIFFKMVEATNQI